MERGQCSRLAASLAYYTSFSLAPLLLLVISIAGLFGGQEAVHNEVMVQVEGLVGQQGKEFIESMLISASQPRNGLLASAVGIIALLFGALGVFAELQNAMNTIWELKPKPTRVGNRASCVSSATHPIFLYGARDRLCVAGFIGSECSPIFVWQFYVEYI
jgi:uncharacterized BrkB/YihY/UPF0761 family membrane protein